LASRRAPGLALRGWPLAGAPRSVTRSRASPHYSPRRRARPSGARQIVFDRHGRCSEFAEHFHKMMARSQNALRGRWENFWSSGEPGIVRLVDRQDVIAKLVYAAINPVKDRLVDRVHHWPGVHGYRTLLSGRPLRAHRPRHFFRNRSPMPEVVTLELTV